MPAGATYEPIATTTTTSSAASIVFNSISGSYTDLKLVLRLKANSNQQARLQFNSDTASNYSVTRLYGTGTSAGSDRFTSQTSIILASFGSTEWSLQIVDIFNYAGSTNKTVLSTDSSDQNGSGGVSRIVGLWRSTAAITSITVTVPSTTFVDGTVATLYGIKAA